MDKTKEQLLTELKTVKEQLAMHERIAQYRTASDETRALFDAFKASGFTDEQAMQLLLAAMNRGM